MASESLSLSLLYHKLKSEDSSVRYKTGIQEYVISSVKEELRPHEIQALDHFDFRLASRNSLVYRKGISWKLIRRRFEAQLLKLQD